MLNRIFNDAHRLIESGAKQHAVCVYGLSHREKLGWLEQDHLCGPGLLYNYDLTGFVSQTLQNIAVHSMPTARFLPLLRNMWCSGRYECFLPNLRMGMYLCGITFHVL